MENYPQKKVRTYKHISTGVSRKKIHLQQILNTREASVDVRFLYSNVKSLFLPEARQASDVLNADNCMRSRHDERLNVHL